MSGGRPGFPQGPSRPSQGCPAEGDGAGARQPSGQAALTGTDGLRQRVAAVPAARAGGGHPAVRRPPVWLGGS